jgi:hypothetical protein
MYLAWQLLASQGLFHEVKLIECHGCISFFIAGLKYTSNTISEYRTLPASEYKEDITVQRTLVSLLQLEI